MSRTTSSNRWSWEQLKAIGVTLVLAVVGTIVIAYIAKALVGLRPPEEVEIAGSGPDRTRRGGLRTVN